MNSLKVLDVTLRDGGCVNNFDFGHTAMEKILAAQEASGVEVIELGYIDEYNGSEYDRTQFCNEKVIPRSILKHKKQGVTYVAMMDFGKYDVSKLQPRTLDGIDGIRLAFHKMNWLDIVSIGKAIISKGYQFYIQPMLTLRYSDKELLDLIDLVNQELPNAAGFYIVDSFGELRPNDMNRILNLVDHNLIPAMTLGFHSHNNLQMSYSNAIEFVRFPTNRNLMLDASIMGMGKGAGNLCIELLLEHLNLFYGKDYQISPLLEVIDKIINQLHAEYYWGYAPEYYLSSAAHCTPSYASHYYNKHMLPIAQVAELLGMIADNKKKSFDKAYAEELYRQFNENKSVDDSFAVKDIREDFSGKNVLIVAPGKSIATTENEILMIANRDDVVSVGLNIVSDFGLDYILTTRKDVYDSLILDKRNLIVSSNISKGGRGNVKVLDYKKWVNVDEGGKTHDSSAVIAFNLLATCNIKKIMLVGFDGFSLDINANYYDSSMRYPVVSTEVHDRNEYNIKLIRELRKRVTVEFITRSVYEEDE